MPMVGNVPARIAISPDTRRLLDAQSGVIGRQQALGLGLSRHVIQRFLDDERWFGLSRGVYTEARLPSWTALAWAGVLAGGRRSVVGCEAAGYLHGLMENPPPVIAIWIGDDRRQGSYDHWRFINGTRLGVGDLPRTRFLETVLDLCAGALTDDAVIALIARSVGGDPARQRELSRILEARPRQPWRRLIRDVMGDVGAGIESPLERRFLLRVERPHHLPRGERQVRGEGGRIDVVVREFGLLLELDGRRYHLGERARQDRFRDNLHSSRNLLTLRYDWYDVVHDACRVAAEIANALSCRGWPGTLARCPRCPSSMT